MDKSSHYLSDYASILHTLRRWFCWELVQILDFLVISFSSEPMIPHPSFSEMFLFLYMKPISSAIVGLRKASIISFGCILVKLVRFGDAI